MAFLLGATGCRTGTDSYAQKFTGGIEVKEQEARGPLPQQVPQILYIADFALDVENYSGDEGIRGVSPDRLGQGVLGQAGQRLPHPFAKDDASEKAHQIVETMAESLVQGLSAKGVQAERLGNTAGNLPREGWLVQGVFTEVDEGNRIKRAVIGFGKGATSMDLQVCISDFASPVPRAPFVVFGTVKNPSKLPGAVVTMNPYVAAAKFVMQKNATEKDIKRTAEQVVEEILRYEQQIKGQ